MNSFLFSHRYLFQPGAGWLLITLAALRALAADVSGWQSFGAGGMVGQAGGFSIQGTFGPMAAGVHSGGSFAIADGFLTALGAQLAIDPPPAGAPTISHIGPQVINEDEQTSLIPFQIADSNTAVGALILTRETSDPGLVPLNGIILGGSGSNRTVRIRPAANAIGTVLITLNVSDGVQSARESFVVNVLAVNDPPTLSRIGAAGVNEDNSTNELPFLIGDLETPTGELQVSASAADPGLVPPGNITLGGSGANRWLKLTPAPNRFGGTTITYRVTDGDATTELSFPFTVISNNDAPTVNPIADAVIASDETATVEFTIADVDHSLAELTLNFQSDNTALINGAAIKRTDLGGGKYSLGLTPIIGRTGVAVITIVAVDPRGAAGRSQFKLTVVPAVPKLDFGDAPTAYPVLLAANGARHNLKPGFFLGAGVDAEADGQPDPTATGDDANSPDDEDGVKFPLDSAGRAVLYNNPAAGGAGTSSNTITVIASAAGKLDGWVDFNRDGDWNDAGERIFAGRALVAGSNTLAVVVSNTVAVGATFARFRFSSVGNLSPGGPADDGEVEDYRVSIVPNPSASSTLFGGLKYGPIGSATTELNPKGWLVLSNLTAQPTSGVSFELGQATGVEGSVFRQSGTDSNRTVALRLRGSQGGQFKEVLQAKWELSEFDASKNVVNPGAIEIAPGGLVYQEANVRLFNPRGEQIFKGHYGSGGFPGVITIAESHAPSLGDTATHEIGHWVGVVADSPRFEDSPPGGGTHLVVSWNEDPIISNPAAASGWPSGRRLTMPDGKSVEGVAFGIFSYEGLPQAVDFLERVEVLGSGVGNSFGVSKVGLLNGGFRVNGGGTTLLSGNHAAEINGVTQPFFSLPEADDEVVIAFSEAHPASGPLGQRLCCFDAPVGGLHPPRLKLPPTAPGSTLRMSAIQFPQSLRVEAFDPRVAGLARSFVTEISVPSVGSAATSAAQPAAGSPSTYRIKLSYAASNAASARFGVTGYCHGQQVEAFTLDGKGTDVNVEEVELFVSGPGGLVTLQPGFLNRGQSTPHQRLIFDAPMTVEVAGRSFEASELSFSLDRGMLPQTDLLDFSSVIQGPRSWGDEGEPIQLQHPGRDWGDLPFETTQAQSGPSHALGSSLRLGENVDDEADGRASPDGTGDDFDGALPNDEDGVTFESIAVLGTDWKVKIQVRGARSLVPPYIDAFVDWNFNGAFDLALGEKILDRQPVHNGDNIFTIRVPAAATPGLKYARFRLSTVGGLGSGGPAEDGEVEDYVIRVETNRPTAQLSGLVPVPRGSAKLRPTAGGGIELSELAGNGSAGLSVLAPSNAVSRSAGRILLPLNPLIPVLSFTSLTLPFADGLVLEAHYTERNGQRSAPSLRFQGDCTNKPCESLRVAFGGCTGRSDELVRVSGFVDGRATGFLVQLCGEFASFHGSAQITHLGWAAFPVSAMVFFDREVTFTSAEGRSMSAKQFRFSSGLFAGGDLDGTVGFDGVEVYGSVLGAIGGVGFGKLQVINPAVASIRNLTILPNGNLSAEFTAEESVFYRVEESTLGSAGWTDAAGFSEIIGGGGTGTLITPSAGNVPDARFFRLRIE